MLVPVPWQSGLLVHQDLLVKLQQVEARLGRPPMLYGSASAWRSYAQQKALYDAYLAGDGNVASNPESGNRTHMRGVAADLQDTSQAMQRACVAVGLQRDPAEAWHWQLSTWRNYPIIPTYTPPTSGDQQMRIIYNLDGTDDTTKRAIVGELSFQIITGPQSIREEKLWGKPVNFTLGEWKAARDLVELRRAAVGLPPQSSGSTDLGPVLAKLDEVPTAEENAQAARRAIVAP